MVLAKPCKVLVFVSQPRFPSLSAQQCWELVGKHTKQPPHITKANTKGVCLTWILFRSSWSLLVRL